MKGASLRKVAQALGLVIDLEVQVTGFQIDSRAVGPGELFFALPGERTDGHRHLREVAAKGAVAAVVAKGYVGDDFGLKLLAVEDVALTLRQLAQRFIEEARGTLQLVGITGSVGKTTTKDFAATILEGRYPVGKTLRSYNSKLTFPLTLLNRDPGWEVLVLEMGMSMPGEMKRLVEIAPSDIAALTKISLAHAVFFDGGLEAIAAEKASIFDHDRVKIAIFTHDLLRFPVALEKIRGEKVTFSLEEREADYFLFETEGRYALDERGVRAYHFDLPFKQKHVLHDFLAAVAVARSLKMDWDVINQRVAHLRLPSMRFECFEKEGVLFVNDAYNASPESMRAALSSLPVPKEGGKRIALLGAMCDLGGFSESSHREVGQLARESIDHLLVFGQEALPLFETFQEGKKPTEHFTSHGRMVKRLKEVMSPGDVVLVKGSRAMKMETVFELLNTCFC